MADLTTVPAPRHLTLIELLRFLAAVVVVVFHTKFPVLVLGHDLGEIGVKVFFVISGFVIATSTERSKDVPTYFVKRIARIVPAYWVITILFALSTHVIHSNFGIPTTGEILKSLFFIPYQKFGVMPVVFVGWTLNLEMFFYAVYGLAMATSHKHRNLITSVLLLALASAALALQLPQTPLTFYVTINWICFVFGIGLAWFDRTILKGQQYQSLPKTSKLAWLGGVCLALGACALVPTLVTLGIFWGVLVTAVLMLERFFPVQPKVGGVLAWLGALTYSLYLVHPLAISALTKFTHGAMPDGSLKLMLAAVPFALFAAIAYYFGVDKPGHLALQGFLMKRINHVPAVKPVPGS